MATQLYCSSIYMKTLSCGIGGIFKFILVQITYGQIICNFSSTILKYTCLCAFRHYFETPFIDIKLMMSKFNVNLENLKFVFVFISLMDTLKTNLFFSFLTPHICSNPLCKILGQPISNQYVYQFQPCQFNISIVVIQAFVCLFFFFFFITIYIYIYLYIIQIKSYTTS